MCVLANCQLLCFRLWLYKWENDVLFKPVMERVDIGKQLLDTEPEKRERRENLVLFFKWLNMSTEGVDHRFYITIRWGHKCGHVQETV